MTVNEAKALYGYLDEEIPGDINNLRSQFNSCMERIYNKLSFYFGDLTAREVYNEIYETLLIDLRIRIISDTPSEVYHILLSGGSSVVVGLTIGKLDPFNKGCFFSESKFSEIQKDIVRESLPDWITGNQVSRDIHNKDIAIKLCKKYRISRIRYSKERLKVTKEAVRLTGEIKRAKKEGKTYIK